MSRTLLAKGDRVEVFGLAEPRWCEYNHCTGYVIGFGEQGYVHIQLLPQRFANHVLQVQPQYLNPVQLDTSPSTSALAIRPATASVDINWQAWLSEFLESARMWNSEWVRRAGNELYVYIFVKLEHSLQIRSSCGSAGWAFKVYTLEDLVFGGIWISEGLSPCAPMGIKRSLDHWVPAIFPKDAYDKRDTEHFPLCHSRQ